MKSKNVNFGNITQSSVLYSSIYLVYSYIECFRHKMPHSKKNLKRSTDHNQVLGYALLKDNAVMDDPEDFYVLPVKDTNYGKARPDNLNKNLVSDSDV